MRRIYCVLVVLVLAGALTSVASAQNAHFIKDGASVNSTGQLVVSFKESGVGDNVSISYTAGAALATATYLCINGGGNHPSATNKETVSGPVSGVATLTSGKNGTISGSV